MSVLLTLGLIACAAGGGSGAGGPEPLLIACDFENPPFASLDARGEPVGHDVELGEELARRLGRPLVWTRTRFAEILPTIERGEADLAIATIGYTAERDERVDFSRPYFRTGIAVLVRVGDGEPRTIEDLRGRRLTAGIGTTSEFAVRKHGLEAELGDKAPVRRTPQERLLAGEVDGCVMDAPDAVDLAALHPGQLTMLDAQPFVVRPDGDAVVLGFEQRVEHRELAGMERRQVDRVRRVHHAPV
ncbi:MAG: ABC transporter substrate-binding protein, partial [Planctomycetota bacterium]